MKKSKAVPIEAVVKRCVINKSFSQKSYKIRKKTVALEFLFNKVATLSFHKRDCNASKCSPVNFKKFLRNF